MEWSSLLLSIACSYCTVRCYSLYKSARELKYLGFTLSLGILAFAQLTVVAEGMLSSDLTIYAQTIVEWGHIVSLSLVLSALASFIRESKPHFAQFPKAYIALPLLIVVSYFLVKDTFAIKEWLISIYQGGAILVALLMYSVYYYRNKQYLPILGGTILCMITFVLFWYVSAISSSLPWIWKILLSIAIVTITTGYTQLPAYTKKDSQRATLNQ